MPAQGTALGKEPTPGNTSPEGATSIRLEMLLRVWVSNGCGRWTIDEWVCPFRALGCSGNDSQGVALGYE
ncbi:MAG: hypothetical protein DYG96_04690 [Chlorobi bacterium CHB2]|nr:hypothetical protein [Chlorobi bacterium CHB2]